MATLEAVVRRILRYINNINFRHLKLSGGRQITLSSGSQITLSGGSQIILYTTPDANGLPYDSLLGNICVWIRT